MTSPITRRQALAAPLALTACGRHEPYFGKSTPPQHQSLVYEIGGEPSSFDPALAVGSSEAYVMPGLLEGLLSEDPRTLEPTAGLATHYEVDAVLTEFTFFLRGHRSPRGTQLPGAATPCDAALWSDGRPVTAHDFVYGWRRLVDPASGANWAGSLYPVANGKDISEGKAHPETLGVRADDDFTFRISLRTPTAHFLRVAALYATCAVPRHAIQQNGSAWTDPGRMPSCGAFVLRQWKPYDRIVLQKNTRYYDAARVRLEAVTFLPITDGATGVNLYRSGSAFAMHGRAVPPLWIPALRGRKDFHSTPACRSLFYAFNTTRPPFDNALVRYAFHMATNKDEIARFLAGGQAAARTVVPPFAGYQGVAKLEVPAGGRSWDVLSYYPEGARALMKIARADRPVFDLTYPNRTRSKEIAQILQRQWRANLGAEVNLVMVDWNVWIQTSLSLNYGGVIESGTGADYADPNTFFEFFTGRSDGSGWSDPEFNRRVDYANAELQPEVRMQSLAACEECLLRAMPVLPLFFDAYSSLQKPYVRGLPLTALDRPQFKYAWIDTKWRPQ
jgi:ABC-type oligopeptide transport system substrate-binding subunit